MCCRNSKWCYSSIIIIYSIYLLWMWCKNMLAQFLPIGFSHRYHRKHMGLDHITRQTSQCLQNYRLVCSYYILPIEYLLLYILCTIFIWYNTVVNAIILCDTTIYGYVHIWYNFQQFMGFVFHLTSPYRFTKSFDP